MSRSYKKVSVYKDNDGAGKKKRMKRQANKVVRKTAGLFKGNQYQKLFNSWDISDFTIYGDTDDYKGSMK